MLLEEFIIALYNLIVGKVPDDTTLIKVHTRSLGQLGDISFPIPLKNWYHLIDQNRDCKSDHIFHYKLNETNVENGLTKIIEKLQMTNNFVRIQKYKVIKSSVHLFLERYALFSHGIDKVLCETDLYGKYCLFQNPIELINCSNEITDIKNVDLTTLRFLITKSVAINLLKLTNPSHKPTKYLVTASIYTKDGSLPNILCGPVINENGVKDTNILAADIFNKRASDIRMIAQHRYRVNVKTTSEWNEYFSTLGAASVTIELLSNKPHKPVKVSLNDLSGANKGPSFIFYNCARLSVLLKEFENKVNKNIYPTLPELNKVDFTLVNQPEEWELLYVYILQFPLVIRNCIRSIEKGIFNPQHLVTFLSNLSSVFSVYYRRVRILTEPRDHLFAILHSRIYLLKALQYVFHNALRLLNIEPIQEM